MRTCTDGHTNVDHARFCVTCGAPMPVASPWSAPPPAPTSPLAGVPTWSPGGVVGPTPPPVSPVEGPPGGGRRDPATVVAIVVLVLAVLALVSIVAVVGLGDPPVESAADSRFEEVGRIAPGPTGATGEGSGAIELLELGGVGHSDESRELLVVRDGAPLVEGVPIGWGRGVPIWAVPERSTYFSPPEQYSEPWERKLVPVGDEEVLVAWSDGVDTVVSQASLRTGEVEDLYRGEGRVTVFHDVADEWILVVSQTDRGQACSAGRVGSPIREVARGTGCAFSPSGRLLAWDAAAAGGELPTHDVEAFEPDGTRLSSFRSVGLPIINRSGRRVQVGEGGGLAIVDPATGEQLAATGDVGDIQFQGWLRGGSLLYLRTDDAGVVTLEELAPDSNPGREGPLSSGDDLTVDVVGGREQIIVGAQRAGTYAIELIEVRNADEPPVVTELYQGGEVAYEVFDGTEDLERPEQPYVVAWTPGGGPAWFGPVRRAALPEVGVLPEVATPAQMVVDPASETAFVLAHGEGPDTGIGLYSLGREVHRLTKGWDSVQVVDVVDGTPLVNADGGSTEILALATPEEWTVLEEVDWLVRPMVVDGLATWATWDDGVQRGQVRSSPVDGSEPAATVYDDAVVAGRAIAPDLIVRIAEGG